MIFPSNRVRIMVATKPVDFRKGHDGLAALVKNELHKDHFTGTVFVFRSRKADRLKLIFRAAGCSSRRNSASSSTRRPKYACRACTDGIAQAPAPARLIHAGLPTEATIAHVLVSKYADHLPLYRQAQIMSRQGVDLYRSTLADWVGRAAFELRPVFDALITDLKRSTKLFMDETRAPVLDRRTPTLELRRRLQTLSASACLDGLVKP